MKWPTLKPSEGVEIKMTNGHTYRFFRRQPPMSGNAVKYPAAGAKEIAKILKRAGAEKKARAA